MKRILIIGANGLIGNGILNYFFKNFIDIDILCMSRKKSFNINKNIKFYSYSENCFNEISKFEIDIIFYCIGTNSKKINESIYVNVEVLKNIVNKLKILNFKNFIYLSSMKVLGENGIYKLNSNINPISNYAKHKVIAEKFLIENFDLNFSDKLLSLVRLPLILGDKIYRSKILKLVDILRFPIFIPKLNNMRSYLTMNNLISQLIYVYENQNLSKSIIYLNSDKGNLKKILFEIFNQIDRKHKKIIEINNKFLLQLISIFFYKIINKISKNFYIDNQKKISFLKIDD